MKKVFMFSLMMLWMVASAICQEPIEFPDVGTLTPETLFQATIEPMYALVVILFGYLSAFIPGIKRLKPFYRVFAFALILALGLVIFGGASIWKLAFTYFISSGLYLVILSNIIKSPRAQPASQDEIDVTAAKKAKMRGE